MMFSPLSFLLKCFCYCPRQSRKCSFTFILLLCVFVLSKCDFWAHKMTICLFTYGKIAIISVATYCDDCVLIYKIRNIKAT